METEPRKRRCLYVTSSKLTGRGIDEVVLRQLDALVRSGWEVDLVSRSRTAIPGVHPLCGRWNPASFFSWLPSRLYYALQKRAASAIAARHLPKREYDLVISWSKQARRVFQTARLRDIPCVLNCGNQHAAAFHDPARKTRWPLFGLGYLAEEYSLAKRILTASSTARDSFIRHGIREDAVVSIGRGADLDAFHPPADGPGVFRLLFCGRANERKGIVQAIESWKLAGLKDAEFWIVGDIPRENQHLVEPAREHGIRFLGHREDIADIMRQCSAIILLSRNEGLAKSLLEGAASGLPLITTRLSGVEIEEGREGFLVERENLRMIADRIRLLHHDDPTRAEMGRHARLWATTHHGWRAFSDRFMDQVTLVAKPR